ncbi:NuoF family protein [Dactylosporangium matsuzakiense]|uniref:NADH dehydrogenase n=1 Tax=Dactylosporangium matsuzakiense TaxID=53360 RepID=A0A9W6KSD5_9ACTN|nr:NuoF family protein [Dactylosporangium matsuzakiense]GLL04629.1 NADH dehydrogenase [Dactylosporangium matsuzakiense]
MNDDLDPHPRPIRRSRHMADSGALPDGTARVTAHVCQAAGCLSSQSNEVARALVERLRAEAVSDVGVKRVGCLGLCAAGPLVHLPETGDMFGDVTIDSPRFEELVQRLKTADPANDPRPELPTFFTRQTPVVLENSGFIDPEEIDDYLARDGYAALRRVVTEMTPAQVIEQVVASGLRGRGGAGFPVGIKWQTVAKSASPDRRYVVCNADEGDPGAFMDRSVLESDPHRVIEGMAIAAYALGADTGYIYCRAEYPLAVQRLRTAIRLAKRRNMLGDNILDTQFSFNVDVRLGAGAFVCGEETALLASIEGQRGSPRPRPPYPATSGLRGRPTLINNVESFANIPPIIRKGGAWYATIGTGRSKGTKVFALAGRVARTGLIEVPMGITLREVIFDIGGGIVDGRPFKAVQTGGPSGGCIPAELLDIPLDYESLSDKGSIMGSGGMIVLDDTSCMVELARYFMEFSQEESCGKCIPCRSGTTQLGMLLTRITEGRAQISDLDRLEELSRMVKATSLCGLGQNAPNPILSTLRYFRNEYLAHIADRVCPAGVCPVSAKEVELV